MPIERNEGLSILFDTINLTLRHQDYDRVKKVAEDFTTYATGDGIDKKLRQFNGRESHDAFEQRKKLTQVNTPDIFHSCIKPMQKISRSPASINVAWQGKDANKTNEQKKRLFEAGKNFWGDKDVTQYVGTRMVDLDSMDPNSFVVIEFNGVVDPAKPETKPQPYPFEVNSAEAINYIYKNNVLQWLIALNKIKIVDAKGNETDGEKYYMYIDKDAITATEVHKDSIQGLIAHGVQLIKQVSDVNEFKPLTDYLFESTEKGQTRNRWYIIKVFEHKIGTVPARRFGTVLDPLTRNRTCIPLVHTAQCYFEKSIKTMSEFDLTNCLHVFPQKIQYSDPCPGELVEGTIIGCDRGYRPDGRTQCGACKGTGFKVHTSAQDIIQIRMPKALNEIVSLENVLVYKHPPIDLLEFQKKFGFEDLRRAAQSAVYNSDIFSRREIATTATEKVLDLDAVYDTLEPFADSWSSMWTFIYTCIATLRELSEGLTITHEFPKDFKMRGVTLLLDDLQKANQNNAPSHIKKAISRDITRKMFADDPYEVLKIETKDKYFPFPGKSEAEINYILANNLTTKFLAVFYSHFDLVFSELEYEARSQEKDFYHMDEKLQRELIKTKVGEYQGEIEKEEKEAIALAFKNSPEDTGDGAGDAGAAAA